MTTKDIDIKQINNYLWEIPKTGQMRVPGRIYASAKLLKHIKTDESTKQVANVATLPGIVGYSLAMPDIHWGYGFPIGGVAAIDYNDGIISPGGVGYDINCGCRLASTNLTLNKIKDKLRELLVDLFNTIPCGVGSSGAIKKLSHQEEKKIFVQGALWAVEKGFGSESDIEHIENHGCMKGAEPDKVSQRALERGASQMGTLGSGNHFLEIGVVDKVFLPTVAEAFGLSEGTVTLLIHTGSRGLGHQICDDYLKVMMQAINKYKINLPDRQLACAPLQSPEGKNYFAAMCCAANYAWANRQSIMHLAHKSIQRTLSISPRELGLQLIYDVCHNIAKIEDHQWQGKNIKVCVHRKGATRAFPPFHPETPLVYKKVGQPVLIPGDMGTYSFVCVGDKGAMTHSFGSTCHGAGRLMSRKKAIIAGKGRAIDRELKEKGILVLAKGRATLAEEMPDAYKNVEDVVEVMDKAGISPRVARLRPIGVIKG
jgi:tRNA-splicing ligase RtcB